MAPRKSHTGSCLTINDEETLMTLRHYELNAYAAVVTALRAEGHINEKKKTILKDLRDILGISIERHKAEVGDGCLCSRPYRYQYTIIYRYTASKQHW